MSVAWVACDVVIPWTSGFDGSRWPAGKIAWWEQSVALLFGGITPVARGQGGLWRAPNAAVRTSPLVRDTQDLFRIAVPGDAVPLLREFMRFTCAYFEQEQLYFQVGSQVEFIDNPLGWPPP